MWYRAICSFINVYNMSLPEHSSQKPLSYNDGIEIDLKWSDIKLMLLETRIREMSLESLELLIPIKGGKADCY